MRISVKSLLIIGIAFVLSSMAAGATQNGVVEGTLDPPDAVAKVSAIREGNTIATVSAGGQGGKFRLAVEAGTYTILVSAPVSSFPVRLDSIVVKPGETTTLPPVLIVPGSGKAVLFGRILPPGTESEVRLIQEGKERAAARSDKEGRYEFQGLSAGEYEVRTTAPGYAEDLAPVTIPENQRVHQTSVLFPVTAIDGVDWTAGRIRATGVGSPPQNAGNPAADRAMTQRAAMADAQRNLLRIVEQIRIDGRHSVKSVMSTRSGVERIQGYLSGFKVVSEKDLSDGRVEIILELPLTGPGGLSRYLPGEN